MDAKRMMLAIVGLCSSACSTSVPHISNTTRYSRVGYPDIVEGQRIIYGRIKPAPIESGVVPRVTILTPIGQEEFASWEESIDPNVALDPTKNYKIELLTSIFKKPDGYTNEVLRVWSGDSLIADASVCYMHKIPMRRLIEDEVALEDYWPYMKWYFKGNNYTPKLFPNDGKSYLGCAVGPEGMTWLCPKCFERSEEWRRKHKIE